MATGLDLVRMPGFDWGNSGRIDFSPVERAIQRHIETQFRQRADEREGERIGIERDRLGLTRDAAALDRERFGLQQQQFTHTSEHERRRLEFDVARTEQDEALRRQALGLTERGTVVAEGQFGLQQTEAQRQEAERLRIRLANEAFGIRQDIDPTRREARFRRLVAGSPIMSRYLGSQGISLDGEGAASVDQVLDHIIAQVPDAQERYQPRPLQPVAPGTTVGRQTPDGGFAPIYTAPRPPRDMSFNDIQSISQQGHDAQTIGQHLASFQDTYTSPGVMSALARLGDWRTWQGRISPSAPPEVQAAARWWQTYLLQTDLSARHALFGASLTPGETSSWQAATIAPNMTPAAIRSNLATRQQILQTAMLRQGRTLVSGGFDPGTISQAYGIPTGMLVAPPGGRQPVSGPPGAGPPGSGPPGASAPSTAPVRPPTVPPGAAWSATRRQWRSISGQIFDEAGQPVQQ